MRQDIKLLIFATILQPLKKGTHCLSGFPNFIVYLPFTHDTRIINYAQSLQNTC